MSDDLRQQEAKAARAREELFVLIEDSNYDEMQSNLAEVRDGSEQVLDAIDQLTSGPSGAKRNKDEDDEDDVMVSASKSTTWSKKPSR